MELENWVNRKNIFGRKKLKRIKSWWIKYCQEVKKYTNHKMFYRDNRIVKKVRKENVKYLAIKKRSKYSKKVSDQRKNKKISCKIHRSTTR